MASLKPLWERSVRGVTSRLVGLGPPGAALRRTLANSGWVVGGNLAGALIALVQGIVVARLLGVDGYGVLGIIMSAVGVANRFTSFRMSEFVIQYVSRGLATDRIEGVGGAVKGAAFLELGASIAGFGLLALLAPLVAEHLVGDRSAAPLVMLYGLVILANATSETATGLLHSLDRFQTQALVSTAGKAAAFLFIVGVAAMDGGLREVIVGYLIGAVTTSAALFLVAWRATSASLGPGWWRESIRRFERWGEGLRFAFSTNASGLVSLVTRDADPLWLGYFRPASDVGYYKLATSLAAMAYLPVAPMAKAVYPEVARQISTARWSDARRLLRQGTLLVSAYVLPIVLVLSAFGGWIIGTFYGAEFTPATPAMIILLVGLGMAQVLFWTRPALLALDRAHTALNVNLVIAVLKLVGIWVLIRPYGYIGAAALLSLLYLFGLWVPALLVQRDLRRREAGA